MSVIGLWLTDTSWQPVDSVGVSESSVSVSVADLKPRAQYQFRVIAVNSRGISYPSLPSLNVLPQGFGTYTSSYLPRIE